MLSMNIKNESITKLSENRDIANNQIQGCIDIFNKSMNENFPNHFFIERKDWDEIINEPNVDWHSCRLLIEENKLIGFYLNVGNSLAKMGLLQLFAIDSNHQGKGLGRILLEDCLDEMDNFGCTNKIAFAKREMPETLKFYQKIWGKIDFNNNITDEYGDSIVKINFNKRQKKLFKNIKI
jgi:GNAT superfamily N-acetyltransferase